MGIIDKLMFWKKEPKLDFDTGLDMNTQVTGPDPGLSQGNAYNFQQTGDPYVDGQQGSAPQYQQNPPFPQSPYQQPDNSFQPHQQGYMGGEMHEPKVVERPQQNLQGDSYDKNLEIVSMKLDNLKVALENINQRLINIERMAMEGSRQDRRRGNW